MSEQLAKVVDASVDVIRSINFSNMNPYGAAAFATVGVAMCMAYAYGQHEKYKYGGRSYGPVKDVTYKHKESRQPYLS